MHSPVVRIRYDVINAVTLYKIPVITEQKKKRKKHLKNGNAAPRRWLDNDRGSVMTAETPPRAFVDKTVGCGAVRYHIFKTCKNTVYLFLLCFFFSSVRSIIISHNRHRRLLL